jgi:hypothetical protein
VGSTDIDVVLKGNRFLEVGGEGKAKNLADFGTQMKTLAEYAKEQGGQAFFYYDSGSPQEALDVAIKWLGTSNVLPIPGK